MAKPVKTNSSEKSTSSFFTNIDTEILKDFDNLINKINIDNLINHKKAKNKLLRKLSPKNLPIESINKKLSKQHPKPVKINRRNSLETLILQAIKNKKLEG